MTHTTAFWWDPSMELGLTWCRCQETWTQIHPTWESPVFTAMKPLFPFVITQDGKETLWGYTSTPGLFVLQYREPKLGSHTWGKHSSTELGQLLYQVRNSLTCSLLKPSKQWVSSFLTLFVPTWLTSTCYRNLPPVCLSTETLKMLFNSSWLITIAERERERNTMQAQVKEQLSGVRSHLAEAGTLSLLLPFHTLQASGESPVSFFRLGPSSAQISDVQNQIQSFTFVLRFKLGHHTISPASYLFWCFNFPRKLVTECLLLLKRQT